MPAGEQPRVLVAAVLDKIDEQLERTAHLIRRIPAGCLDWKPPVKGAWAIGVVLGHLLECAAGICAVLAAAEPERLAHFRRLRSLPVNHSCSPAEAIDRLPDYRAAIDEGFALLHDADLGRLLPTLFVPQGETLLTLLLGNLEHFVNHKHQLFTYLQLMGVDVGTMDLYRIRGE